MSEPHYSVSTLVAEKNLCTQVCNDKRNCKYICHSLSHSGTMFKETTGDERHHREEQKKRLKDKDGQSGG